MSIWSENEVFILKKYYGTIKITELATKLPGRTAKAISWQARKYRLYANRQITNRRHVRFNENFFDTPNAINSYWAGFIAADGCIGQDRDILYLYQSQLEPIVKFQECIAHNGKISYRKRQKTQEYCLTISSSRIIQKLRENFNIVPAKSLILKAPTHLNRECSLAFINGYIDGDGSVCIVNPTKRKRYLLISATGTKSITQWISKIINTGNCSRRRDCDSEIYRWQCSCVSAVKCYELIMSLYILDNIRMNRKFPKVKEFVDDKY